MSVRQVVLDTETTGLSVEEGHRIIEIGAIELIDRKRTGHDFHSYFNADRDSSEGALAVHGLTRDFLKKHPRFSEKAKAFISYIQGSEVVIHNAPFDIGFLNYELSLLGEGYGRIEDYCSVFDTLVYARKKHEGKKNNLDALCVRYQVDKSARTFHGALLDAHLLADVFLPMTREQLTLFEGTPSLSGQEAKVINVAENGVIAKLDGKSKKQRHAGRVILATEEEMLRHEAFVKKMKLSSFLEDV